MPGSPSPSSSDSYSACSGPCSADEAPQQSGLAPEPRVAGPGSQQVPDFRRANWGLRVASSGQQRPQVGSHLRTRQDRQDSSSSSRCPADRPATPPAQTLHCCRTVSGLSTCRAAWITDAVGSWGPTRRVREHPSPAGAGGSQRRRGTRAEGRSTSRRASLKVGDPAAEPVAARGTALERECRSLVRNSLLAEQRGVSIASTAAVLWYLEDWLVLQTKLA